MRVYPNEGSRVSTAYYGDVHVNTIGESPDCLFLVVDLGQLRDSLVDQLRRFGQP
jgi:hypothetical protein